MVNVDDRRGLAEQPPTQDLHVLGQHHQVNSIFLQESELTGFGCGFALWRNGDVVVIDTEGAGHRFQVGVIADDQGDLGGQFSRPLPPDQIQKAVALLAGPQRNATASVGKMQFPVGLDPTGNTRKGGDNFPSLQLEALQVPLDAAQEQSCLGIRMVIGVNDVAAVAVDEAGELGYQTFLIS
jgi:hypothetical protein